MKKFLFLTLAATVFASCSKDKTEEPVNNDIPASYYELSADGLTLVKWTNTSTTSLDMQADSKLQKVNTIGANAFRNTKLQSINLPVNLKEIGNYAFISSSIRTVTFNSASNITFGEAAFENTDITSIKLPNTKEITNSLFNGCYKLKEVQFGKVEKIGDYAFYNCTALNQINLDNTGVTEIGEAAFALCEKAEKAILPETISIIGARAFSGCFVLSNITVKAFLEVPTLKSYSAFNSGSTIRRNIYVPSRRVNDYKNAPNWSTWKDEITAIIE
ncbi:leucine-rich repeat domain-containing protein [Capnocytophaga sputigena]|uniref:leucine-rich repeat domain-containing protein n=1 Tax=Capnocytophaga sputigena TaxID=1019 RepID=UPI0028D1004D|nr:leucine-rich repeat protein [Capnocytophaga sputigena]